MERLKVVALMLAVLLILPVIPVSAAESEIVELEEAKDEIVTIIEEQHVDEIIDLSNNALETIKELETELDGLDFLPSLEAIGKKYGVDTIEPRIELTARYVDLIVYITNNLQNKVADAHNKAALEISLAFAVAIDPLATVEKLQAKIDNIDTLRAQLESYPDLRPEDVATIYTKDRLNTAIWEVRFARDKEILGNVPFETYHQLNRNITKAVGVWFDVNATVEEVETEMDLLQDALNTARAAL